MNVPSAVAGTITTTNEAVQATIPASLALGAFQSNTQFRVMFERATELGSALAIDMMPPALIKSCSSGVNCVPAGSISAGTSVESWMVHADPVSGTQTYLGKVTFSNRILGVILLTATLNATDSAVGNPGTTYATGQVDRGMEYSSDGFTWDPVENSLSFNLSTSTSLDNIRVITETPEPSSFALLAIGFTVLIRRRS